MSYQSYKFKILFFYFFSIVIALLLAYKLLTTLNDTSIEKISKDHFKTKFTERNEFIDVFFKPYISTLKSIILDENFKEYVSNNTNKKNIENYFLSIKRSLPCSTQIRYIDLNGNEVIRVDGTPIGIFGEKAISKIVPNFDLQNKASTDYFKSFLNLEKGDIGFSKINLNKEHDKITLPKQPTIRVATPIYDGENKKGILVINICLRTFFNLLNNSTLYNIHLIDDNGIYLNHTDSRYGLLGNNMSYSIFDSYPDEAQEILDNESFYCEHIYSNEIYQFNNYQNIKMVLELKFEEKVLKKEQEKNYIIVIAIIFIILLIPIIFYIIKLPELLRSKLKDKIEIENKNKFIDSLLRSIPIPMFYKSSDGIYFDINTEFTNVFGFEYEEIVGKSVYQITDKHIADIYKQKDDDLINSNSKEPQIYNSVVKNFKTGELHNVIFHKNLFFDTKGKPKGIIGAVVDITELTDVKDKLEKLNNDLEQKIKLEVEKNLAQELQLFESSKLAMIGEMMNNIIHQWNQPLTIIGLKSFYIQELINRNEELDKNYINKEMKYIANSVNRLSEVTHTFSDYLKEKKEFKTIELHTLIDKSLTISGTVLQDKGFKLIKQYNNQKTIYIETIQNELIEVIVNIINNAIDALEEKNIGDGFVKVDVENKNNKAIISIEDNAGGIPENILAKIFERYFTTKEKLNGTGLGLYMSRQIITQSLNGNLYVKNTDIGAKFFIELPLKKD